GEPVLPGGAHRVAHELRIGAGRAQRRAPLVGERDADQLADELGDAADLLAGQVAPEARAQLLAPDRERLAVDDAGEAPDRGPQDAERRAGADRVAAPDEQLQVGAELAAAPHELVGPRRLAGPGGGGDEHGARARLLDDGAERGAEEVELAVASDAAGRLAEQRPRLLEGQLAPEVEAAAVAGDVEAAVEEA